MKWRTQKQFLGGLLVAAGMGIGTAQAVPVAPLFEGTTLLSDNSAELLVNIDGTTSDTSGAPTVTEGDIFLTMLGINTIESDATAGGPPGGQHIGGASSFNEITAIAAFEVDDVTDDGVNPQGIDLFDFTFSPLEAGDVGGIPASLWAPFTNAGFTADGSLIALVFEDPANDYNRQTTLVNGFNSASGGTLRAELAMNPALGDFFVSTGPQDTGAFNNLPEATFVVNSTIGLDWTIRDQFFTTITLGSNITGGNGGLASPVNGSEFPIFDNIDFTVNTVSVPEPGTLLLMAAGLLALPFAGRRFGLGSRM